MVILMKNNINEDIPLGFLFEIFKNNEALNNFSKLDISNQLKIKNYIQNSSTGYEVKEKINTAIENLENNSLDFLN